MPPLPSGGRAHLVEMAADYEKRPGIHRHPCLSAGPAHRPGPAPVTPHDARRSWTAPGSQAQNASTRYTTSASGVLPCLRRRALGKRAGDHFLRVRPGHQLRQGVVAPCQGRPLSEHPAPGRWTPYMEALHTDSPAPSPAGPRRSSAPPAPPAGGRRSRAGPAWRTAPPTPACPWLDGKLIGRRHRSRQPGLDDGPRLRRPAPPTASEMRRAPPGLLLLRFMNTSPLF